MIDIIVTRAITIMILINKVKLELLLSKNNKKSSYTTLISKSFGK